MIIRERDLKSIREEFHSKKIVLGFGTFDLFHEGHISYIDICRRLGGEGGVLVIGVTNDAAVTLSKGPDRSILPQRVRQQVVNEVKGVDYVFVVEGLDNPGWKTCIEAAWDLQPNTIVLGTGIKDEEVQDWLKNFPRAEVLTYRSRFRSTTEIIDSIRHYKEERDVV